MINNLVPNRNTHILLVEDDVSLATWISEYLISQGYHVTMADQGDNAIRLIKAEPPDLIILDINLPIKDGFEICREARSFYKHPILMMTARDEEMDEVLGLELGADDYIMKPVRPRALLARIKSLLRRSKGSNEAKQNTNYLTFGSLKIDLNSRTTLLDNKVIPISSNEFNLLWILASHAGEVVSRELLVKELRGIEYDSFDRSTDILISRVRKKLSDDPSNPYRIKTIWGKGYLFAPDAWQ